MASISKRPDGIWRARYRDDAGKEHARHFPTRNKAQAWLDSVTTSIGTGAYVDPRRAKMTVGEWSEHWIATKANRKPSTVHTYESLLKTKIRPRWEDVPLSKVENDAVAAWIASLSADGLSASRVRQTHTIFSAMLDAAVAAKRIAANPARVALPTLPPRDHTYLTHEQLADLADACGDYRTLVLVLGYVGLRFGEAAALRTKRVDPLKGRLEIVESMTEVSGHATFGPPKTHQIRSVPVPGFLRDELVKQLAGKGPDDFVFSSPRALVLRDNNFRRGWWNEGCVKVGLGKIVTTPAGSKRYLGIAPHALRHTAASLAIAAGATVKGVQIMLGHKSAAVTLDIYAGLFDTELEGVAVRLDAAAKAAAEISRTSRGLNVVSLPSARTGDTT